VDGLNWSPKGFQRTPPPLQRDLLSPAAAVISDGFVNLVQSDDFLAEGLWTSVPSDYCSVGDLSSQRLKYLAELVCLVAYRFGQCFKTVSTREAM
jgi:hypothetical protein